MRNHLCLYALEIMSWGIGEKIVAIFTNRKSASIKYFSHIYLKFGRHVTESLLEVTVQLELSVTLLKLKIPYKYVVFTEKSQTKEDGWYEFIRLVENRFGGDPNRVLHLSERAIKQAINEGIISVM